MTGTVCEGQMYDAVSQRYDDQIDVVDDRKTSVIFEDGTRGLTYNTNGSVTITRFSFAKQLLKSRVTTQAGFNADLVKLFPQKNTSVLFLEGEAHRHRRSVVARFFAPTAIRKRYRPAIEALSIRLVDSFVQKGHATLEEMSLELSVGIAAEIVGMTNSTRDGLGNRLGRFFEDEACFRSSGWISIARYILTTQINLFRVYVMDVRPAIRARRSIPSEDLISHLVRKGWSNLDILKEAVTYGTAGMSTTREFIVAAAWHLLERDALRERFLMADMAARHAILSEILRLEPPVSTLYRRTVEPVTMKDGGESAEIPSGTLVAIDLRGVNTDEAATGRCPFRLDPDREPSVHDGLMSFGEGHHRCPGAAVAMEETAIFLNYLLRVPGIRLASTPRVSRNKMSTGYVLRNAIVTTEAAHLS